MSAQRTIYVHAGLPKTGTSYLQSVCARSETALAAQGLALLPGAGTTAFRVMLDAREELRPDLDPPEHFGGLEVLAGAVAALDAPRALLSQELLCLATHHQVSRLLEAMPDGDVHLVLTVRDLATLLPSLWQQQVKARGTTSYDAFLDRVMADGGDDPRGYDLLAVLEQWVPHLPPEHIHVVTVRRQALLDRFCGVLGVDASSLDTSRTDDNTSIGLVQAELLRRVNVALGDRLPHARAGYRGPGKGFLAETILRAQGGAPARLPERVRPWVEDRTSRMVHELERGGYDVVGDLADLTPGDDAFADQAEVGDPALVDAAAEALAAILVDRSESRSRLRARVKRQRARIEELEERSVLERVLGRRLR